MTFISSAIPWYQLALFPALLVFIGVLLFSTATLAFYLKQNPLIEAAVWRVSALSWTAGQCARGTSGGGHAVLYLYRDAAFSGIAGG
ncbi:MAG TPA: hypothetical protein VGN34_32815 [Ktedonobacteraceae bacterium]|jgi:hypothetical protein